MSRNGSGTYSLPVNSWNPAQNSVPATAADWQSLINDVASALTQSVSRDGQTTMTGSLPMGGNKLTGLAAGTALGDSLRWEQLFSQGISQDLASAATVDIGAQLTTVLNITGTTTITSFGTNYNGPRFLRFDGILTLTHGASLVLPGASNITTAAGDAAIVVPLGTPAAGWRVVAYQRASGEALVAPTSVPAANLTGTVAIANGGTGQTTALAGFDALKQAATDAYTGVVELATSAEAQAGTDTTRVLTPSTLKSAQIQLGTAVASTSGTAIDFTGIPSWVKKITVMFNGVSTSGTSVLLIQLGSASGFEATGYLGAATQTSSGGSSAGLFTTGIALSNTSAASIVCHGSINLNLLNQSANLWSAFGITGRSDAAETRVTGFNKTLSGPLDRIRITTVNGTDAFDTGSINISWE